MEEGHRSPRLNNVAHVPIPGWLLSCDLEGTWTHLECIQPQVTEKTANAGTHREEFSLSCNKGPGGGQLLGLIQEFSNVVRALDLSIFQLCHTYYVYSCPHA